MTSSKPLKVSVFEQHFKDLQRLGGKSSIQYAYKVIEPTQKSDPLCIQLKVDKKSMSYVLDLKLHLQSNIKSWMAIKPNHLKTIIAKVSDWMLNEYASASLAKQSMTRTVEQNCQVELPQKLFCLGQAPLLQKEDIDMNPIAGQDNTELPSISVAPSATQTTP